MNRITTLIMWVIISMVGLISCGKDFLERGPKASLFSENLANEKGVKGLLIGAYALLNHNGTGASWESGKWIFGGVASDDAHTGTEAGALQPVPQYESYIHSASTQGLDARWVVLFAGVQRANDVIRLLELAINNGEITEESATQISAEARFLRGLYHLEAMLMWGNIPFIDESISATEGNYFVPNDESAWPKIEDDFKYAAENLTETKSEVGRANSWAAKSYLLKSYMFQHKFTDAKVLADDIIQNGKTSNGLKYDLNKHYFDNFRASKKHGPEQIFAVMHSVNDGAGGARGNGPNGEGNAGPYNGPFPSYGFYQPSFSLVNSYKTDQSTGLPLIDDFNKTDLKHDLNIPSSATFIPTDQTVDARLDWVVGRRGIPFLDWGVNPGMSWVRQQSVGGPYLHIKNANYKSEPDSREEGSNSTANNYNMIRFADVLLWAAEVEVELGNFSKAEEYVNRVRVRAANPEGWVKKYINNAKPELGFSNEAAANYKVGLYNGQFASKGKNYARECVRFERKLELAMEHHRFFDLQRYDQGTGYMADVLNSYIAHELSVPDYNYYYMATAKFTKGKNEYYPIPLQQIDLSFKDGVFTLIQNPNYN